MFLFGTPERIAPAIAAVFSIATVFSHVRLRRGVHRTKLSP
jgi:hypothetical protein